MDEPFVADSYRSHENWGRRVMPSGEYFLLGDHRSNSSDSRRWGFVPRTYILGRIRYRWWPTFSSIS